LPRPPDQPLPARRHARESDRRSVPGSRIEPAYLLDRVPGADPARLIADRERQRPVHRQPLRVPESRPVVAARSALAAGGRVRRRKRVNRVVEATWLAASILAIAVLATVTLSVLVKAIPGLDLDLFTKTP